MPWRNFSKIATWSSSAMPTPVSVTFSTRSLRPSRSALTTIRPPSGVNLMALESRLLRICCTLAWSWSMSGRSGSISVSRSMFLRSVSGRAMSHWAETTGSMRKSRQPDFHLAAFDLGQVENVVDHLQQHLARRLDVLHVALLLVVERGDRLEHVAEADDALSGVRSSWLIVARKSLFSRFIS